MGWGPEFDLSLKLSLYTRHSDNLVTVTQPNGQLNQRHLLRASETATNIRKIETPGHSMAESARPSFRVTQASAIT